MTKPIIAGVEAGKADGADLSAELSKATSTATKVMIAKVKATKTVTAKT